MLKRLRYFVRRFFHGASNVRWKAAQALGKIRDPKAVPHLIAVLDDEDSEVRIAAIAALGVIGDNTAISHLAAKLKDSNSIIRARAAAALGCFKSKDARSALLGMLQDKHFQVRAEACAALAEIGSDDAIAEALKKMLRDPKREVQEAAAESLVKLGQLSESWLTAALERRKPYRRQSLADLLAASRGDTIQQGASSLPAQPVAQNRSEEIGQDKAAGNPFVNESLPVLLKALQNGRWKVRAQACDALGKFSSEEVSAALTYALEDADWRVQKAAADSLIRIGKPALAFLTAAAKNKWGYARWRPVEVLGDMGDKSSIILLVSLLQDRNDYVRERAAEALGKLGDLSAAKPLAESLTDSSEVVRRSAAGALTSVGKPVVNHLLPHLKHRKPHVQFAAASVLARIGDPSAVDPMVRNLHTADASLREVLVTALGELGSARAIPALAQQLRSPSEYAHRPANRKLR